MPSVRIRSFPLLWHYEIGEIAYLFGAQTLSQDQPQTKEEKDLISQSKKKCQRRSNGEPISIPAPTQVDDVIMADFTFQQNKGTHLLQDYRFFKETVEQGKAQPHIYDGADAEDEFDAFVVEDMERGSEGTLSGQNSIYPQVFIPYSLENERFFLF